MSSKKKTRKPSDKDSVPPLHHIGSFPKHMSKSWPADIEGISNNNDYNKAPYSSTTDLSHFNDSYESYPTVSWLGKVLTKFGFSSSSASHHSSITSIYEEYPTHFPYQKFSKESKVCVFSNNLTLDDRLDKLSNVSVLRLTKNIFIPNGNGITQLPAAFSKLDITLRELDLRGNPLQNIPHVLFSLSNLTILNLENCMISDIPSQISNLCKLKKLYMDNNQIKSPTLKNLQSLEHLSLSNNGITDIAGIQLLSLQVLDVSENFISEIPEDMLEGSVLKRLILRGNSLLKLPNSIRGVSTLKWLDASKNLLKRLPDEIGNLSNIKYLNISWNDLTALPESITKLHGLKKNGFFCGENPLQMPPYEVAVEGPQSIESYFKALSSGSSSIHNRRLKLMILGNEKTGKTTLSKAIHTYTEPEPVEERTIGMDFFEWKAEPKPDGLKVLIVDCAGQKKYVLTHQLFMQTGLLFAVVVNLKDYEKTSYNDMIGDWIDLVLARVPKAVILIVPTFVDMCNSDEVKEKCEHILRMVSITVQEIRKENEKDIRGSRTLDDESPVLPTSYLLDESGQTKTYPENHHPIIIDQTEENYSNRINMIPVSNKNHLPGLTLLREEIVRCAYNEKLCPNINHVVPESWSNLEHLCNYEKSFQKTITVEELYKKCCKEFDTEADMIKALKYIDSIGPILYFHSISNIRDIVFLDPNWLSSIFKLIFRHDSDEFFVYKSEHEHIYGFEREFNLDKDYLLKNALLSYEFLRCIWYNDIKDDDYFQKVVSLLKGFDLVHDVFLEQENKTYMLVPWFLPEKCTSWNKLTRTDKFKKSSITCLVETNTKLPDGFFQRFIVKVYSLKLFNDVGPWINGFIAVTEHYRMKVIHEKINNKSCITLEGSANGKDIYHVWEVIIPLVKAMKDFIKEWEGIKYKIYSVCPSCRDKKAERPQFWALDLEQIHDETETISCRLEIEMVDKWLVYPPPTISMQFLPPDSERDQVLDQRLAQTLTADEKDTISGVISDRCSELRAALGVHKGRLEKPSDYTEWRERVLKIITIWEQETEKNDIKNFLDCVNKIRPLPHDVVKICLDTSTTSR